MSSCIEVKDADAICMDRKDALNPHSKIDGDYARYVLLVLLLFNILNYLDRSVLTILVEDIKADFGTSDAQMGFLFGTAFAVFYATFGMALGRLADVWNRKRLIALGVGFWSLMTALSGLARSFLPLALCRFGVAVGESSASPSAYSLIYDYFSPKLRTTALAIYTAGISIGGGLGLYIGGTILDTWNSVFPDPSLAPLGLRGWQATFMIVGLPGLLMALWVATLQEPARGQSDGIVTSTHPHPFREVLKVLAGMLPIANWWTLKNGGRKRRAIATNFASGIVIAIFAYGLIHLTGDVAQWVGLGVGIYASVSWAQGLALRDPVVFGMIFRCPTLICVISSQGAVSLMMVGIPFWAVPLFQRYYGVGAAEIGAVLGLGSPIVGIVGLLLGGVLADKLHARNSRGKLYVWLAGTVVSILTAFYFLSTGHLIPAYAGLLATYFFASVAGAPLLATVNDLVLPRGRATTSAFVFMVVTLVGVALGPYVIGHLSDVIADTGVDSGESLRQAMLWSLLLPIAALLPGVFALKNIEKDDKSRLDRARSLGEVL